MDSISVSYFTSLAGLAFGIAGFGGAIEVLKRTEGRDQEERFLSSILLLSLGLIVSSLLPLALSDTAAPVHVSSLFLGVIAGSLFLGAVLGVAFRIVKVHHPLVFWLMALLSVGFLALLAVGVLYYPEVSLVLPLATFAMFSDASDYSITLSSLTIYKIVLGWAMFVLVVRFLLFIQHVARLARAPG